MLRLSRVLSVVMAVVVVGGALTAGLSPASARDAAVEDLHCVPRGCVDTRDLGASSVTRSKIAGGAVTGAKIADGSVGEVDLGFDALSRADLEGYASQSELSDLASALATGDGSPPNVGSNRVHWQNIVGMPAGFADGFDDMATSGPSGPASDVVCTGCVGSTDLGTGSVNSDKIENGTVTRDDLAFDPSTATALECAGCVGRDDLAGDSVNSAKIENGTVTRDDLAFDPGEASDLECTGCVGTTDLQDGGVTHGKLDDTPGSEAVTTDVIRDGAVTEPKLSFDPATQAELQAHEQEVGNEGSFNEGGAAAPNQPTDPLSWFKIKDIPAEIADGDDAVDGGTAADLNCSGCVSSTDIQDQTITSQDLAGRDNDPSTPGDETVVGAVTSEKIADGTVNSRDMAANAELSTNFSVLPADAGTERISTLITVPPGRNHTVQLLGQMQVSCACGPSDNPAVSWYLTRTVNGVTEVITPEYTEDLTSTDDQVVATISWLDWTAPAGQAVTYTLKSTGAGAGTLGYSNAVLIATDLGES